MTDRKASSSDRRGRSRKSLSGRSGTTQGVHPKFPVGNRLKLGIPLAVFAMAAILGADRQPWVLAACVALAVFGLFFNKPPIKRSLLILWWIGLIFLVWHIFTLAALPASGLGSSRTSHFRQSHQKLSELSQLLTRETKMNQDPGADSATAFAPTAVSTWNYGRLSLNRAGTKRFIITLVGAWAMFWLATAMTLTQRTRFLAYLVVGGGLVAALGLLGQYVIPPATRLWWIFPAGQPVAAGPFLYSHHFTAFCALLAPVALSMVIVPIGLSAQRLNHDRQSSQDTKPTEVGGGLPRQARGESEPAARDDSEIRLSSWSGDWLCAGRLRILYGLCLLALTLPPLLAFSRGATTAVAIGCLVTVFFWLRGRSPTALIGAVVLIGLIFAFLQWPGADRQTSLSLTGENAPRQAMVMREAFAQWRDFKFLGGGAESFRVLNSRYKIETGTDSPLYADNEYLQFLADHGLFGGLLAAAVLAALLVAFWSNFHSRFERTRTLRALRETWTRDRDIMRRHRALYASVISLSLLAAVSGSLAGLLFQFAAGFPTRTPLNAFVLASLLGLIMPLPSKPSPERSRHWHWPLIPFVAVSFIMVLAWSGRELKLDNPHYLRQADLPTLASAIGGAPSYWVPWAELSRKTREQAQARLRQEDLLITGTSNPFAMYQFGVDCLQRAAELNPRNPDLWWELARIRADQENAAPEAVVRPFRMAARLIPENPEVWQEWLDFILRHEHFEHGLELGREATARARPETALAVWREIRQSARQRQLTDYEYRTTVALTELQPRELDQWLERARLESRLQKTEREIQTRRKIATLQPDDWQNWLALGRLHLGEQDRRAAELAFERVLELRPESREEIEIIKNDATARD